MGPDGEGGGGGRGRTANVGGKALQPRAKKEPVMGDTFCCWEGPFMPIDKTFWCLDDTPGGQFAFLSAPLDLSGS